MSTTAEVSGEARLPQDPASEPERRDASPGRCLGVDQVPHPPIELGGPPGCRPGDDRARHGHRVQHRQELPPTSRLRTPPPPGLCRGTTSRQLLMGVLGVLFVSGEYSTGAIRSTLAAVPRRVPVLVAKAIVFGTTAVVAMVASSVGAFFVSQLFLSHYGHGSALSDPGVLRAVVGTGVYLALIGLLGAHWDGSCAAPPAAFRAWSASCWSSRCCWRFCPDRGPARSPSTSRRAAGSSFVTSVRLPDTLAPWPGLVVLLLWVGGCTRSRRGAAQAPGCLIPHRAAAR